MILWATELSRTALLNKLTKLNNYDTVVVRADLKNRTWASEALNKLHAWGGKVYAYVRAPVHYNYKAVASDGYEWVCKMLIEHANAGPLMHLYSGKPMLHPAGYDAYTIPWLLPLRALAKVTAALAYDDDNYYGLLIDGTAMWQIYCTDPKNANYQQLSGKFMDIAQKQFADLETWVQMVRDAMPKAKLIGNGAWEPTLVGCKPYKFTLGVPDPNYRWEYSTNPPLIHRSKWINLLDGTMDEDGAKDNSAIPPYYHQGSPNQQAPRVSQALSMHVQCAKDWLAMGKEYWVGGTANIGAYPQGVQRIV